MPIRVAHCIHSLSLGGAQQVIAQIAGGSGSNEFEHYCYAALGGVSETVVERSRATIRVLPRNLAKFDPTWIFALEAAFRRDRIDIVHAYLFGDSLHGLLAARRAGRIPVLVSLHTNRRALSRLQDFGYRWVLRRANLVVACSKTVRDSFSGVVLRPPDEFIVIPNGIDVLANVSQAETQRQGDVLGALGVPSERLVIASVGRLIALKGVDLLLEAFARCAAAMESDAHFLVIGEGPQRGALEQKVYDLGIGQRVTFAGFRANVREILPFIDIVAFGSEYEALSMTLLEAMAAGRCIVGPAVPGIIDAVSADREASLSSTRDAEGLAGAMLRVVNDGDLRKRLGQAARRRVEQEFAAKRMIVGYEQAYRALKASRDAG